MMLQNFEPVSSEGLRNSWGPFLERPGKFSSRELHFKIKIYRMANIGVAFSRQPARLVSSTYIFTA